MASILLGTKEQWFVVVGLALHDYFLRCAVRNLHSLPKRFPAHRVIDPNGWKHAKCANRDHAKAGFAYSGPFTEALLVGNLATRLQKRILWDAVAMKAKNAPEAELFIRKQYRKGFGIL